MQESQLPIRLPKSPHESSFPVLELAPHLTLADIERAVILTTLQRLRGNRTHAARALGIGIRTLQRKLKEYERRASETNGDGSSLSPDEYDAQPSLRSATC